MHTLQTRIKLSLLPGSENYKSVIHIHSCFIGPEQRTSLLCVMDDLMTFDFHHSHFPIDFLIHRTIDTLCQLQLLWLFCCIVDHTTMEVWACDRRCPFDVEGWEEFVRRT